PTLYIIPLRIKHQLLVKFRLSVKISYKKTPYTKKDCLPKCGNGNRNLTHRGNRNLTHPLVENKFPDVS
ncbi:MAG: hypothetical protein MUP57_05360, partial [Clostridia bacterium]|nr:hypothetical protein [Clostridia bacterium]